MIHIDSVKLHTSGRSGVRAEVWALRPCEKQRTSTFLDFFTDWCSCRPTVMTWATNRNLTLYGKMQVIREIPEWSTSMR